jgi:hypothetical protein
VGAREDQNTLDMIAKKLERLKSEDEVGQLVASYIDEQTLATHAVKSVGNMAGAVRELPDELGALILGTAYTIGFAVGVEFNRISRSDISET